MKKSSNRKASNARVATDKCTASVKTGPIDWPFDGRSFHWKARFILLTPAQLRVIVTIRPKYACRTCTDGVTQAPARPWLIEGALPTEGTLAHVTVAKYADHCPLYRQAQILARSGIHLDRSTLAGWVGKVAFHLGPVVDRLVEHLKKSPKLFMDGEPPGAQPPQNECGDVYTLWRLRQRLGELVV